MIQTWPIIVWDIPRSENNMLCTLPRTVTNKWICSTFFNRLNMFHFAQQPDNRAGCSNGAVNPYFCCNITRTWAQSKPDLCLSDVKSSISFFPPNVYLLRPARDCVRIWRQRALFTLLFTLKSAQIANFLFVLGKKKFPYCLDFPPIYEQRRLLSQPRTTA